MNIKIAFINFWRGFDELSWTKYYWSSIFNYHNIVWINSSIDDADIIVSSVFGPTNSIQQYKCTKILYTRENLNNYLDYTNNLNNYNLIIGFNDNYNQINIPYWYRLMYNYNINIFNISHNYYLNRKNICLISSNPHRLRLSLIKSFKALNSHIDCPGFVGNNMNMKVTSGFSKIEFMKNYYFNICPENSYADGYTTEKLFECCVAGCIPIYYGCEKLNDYFYNKDRILHLKQDLSNYDDVIDKTIYLLNHKNELVEFMMQSPFASNIEYRMRSIKEKINISLQSLLERI